VVELVVLLRTQSELQLLQIPAVVVLVGAALPLYKSQVVLEAELVVMF
jgi:hypothetical protein